jgi:hypothetical protein
MKCPGCGTETYASIGGRDICPNCGYGSQHYSPPIPENRAYREAGHAVMSYLIREGYTDKFLPLDRSLMLPAFSCVAIEGESADWSKLTFSLGSLITVSQVLLAGCLAERIKGATGDIQPPHDVPLVKQASHLIGSYIEEYGGDELSFTERDRQADEMLGEMLAYVNEIIHTYWDAVEALASALQENKRLTEAGAFEVIKEALPGRH